MKVTVPESAYALVAGGVRGIGYAIAEALARRKFNLILIARRLGDLQSIKADLRSKYGVNVELFSFDLSEEQSVDAIAKWCIERDISLKMLCNVAAGGGASDYLSAPLDTMRYFIDLNLKSCITLTHLLLPLLEKNTPAYIMNVSSLAGLAPIPVKNIYSATKSALIFFSYSLNYQLRKKKIHVSCLAPGPVFTKPEIIQETKNKLGWLSEKIAVSPEKVGEIAVSQTLRGKMLIVPGTIAKLSSLLIRIMPKRVITSIYGRSPA